MLFINLIALASVATAATTARATRPKANEYKSEDCSGSVNYGHNSFLLHDVTMDDTTHSVYLTGNWELWSGKTGNGGSCTGTKSLDVSYPSGACISTSAKSWHANLPVKCVRNKDY
ncbi:hypothetical protein RRF57_011339 [Xylaria bambusicola]|uniref:Uncharacterized protein n=1 Tax=Xylaria bambusicola TaxID=326684 RepID=A0AAN7Z9N8_9PEZI